MPAEGTMGRPDPRAARSALVFAGGDPPVADHVLTSPRADLVIAADSGLEHARALGVPVDLVVGDLDSVDPAMLDAAIADGVAVERHPAAKDATDLELALDAAVDRGATEVLVVGVGGGRLDHFLGNVLLLASPAFAGVSVESYTGAARVAVARGGDAPLTITGAPGSLVSLLPVGGPARGIVTTALRYPLRNEELTPGTSRGVSNELAAEVATVELASGVLLVVQPFGGAR